MNGAFIGALVNSALYLASVFAAGIILHNRMAWTLAIMAMGVTYLSYLGHLSIQAKLQKSGLEAGKALGTIAQTVFTHALVWFSIALGAAAGVALLF